MDRVPDYRGLFGATRLRSERECGRLEWSVLDWNETAIRFYRRHGARAMEEWTVYRITGDSLVRLASDLSANAVDWNGRCWIGMKPQSAFTAGTVREPWRNGPCTGLQGTLWCDSPPI